MSLSTLEASLRGKIGACVQLARHETRAIIEAIERLGRQREEPPAVDARDFGFIRSRDHRAVVYHDYIEAQRGLAAGAHKLAAIAGGSIIEAMLMDALQWPEVQGHVDYDLAVRRFPQHGDGAGVEWDRVSMQQLIEAAEKVGLLSPPAVRMAIAARQWRDTIHVNAEVRQHARAGREDTEVLLALVRLIYRDLGKLGGLALREVLGG